MREACLLLAALVVVGGCKREPAADGKATPPASASAVASTHASGPWFLGEPEQAFARARADGALVLLYWGAAWCPPCHELEAEVFSKPRFAEMMRGFVPVHLDGDTEAAQRLGESLGVSAYPTILVLGPGREELLRLNSSIGLDELERALAGVRGEARSFQEAAARLVKGEPRAEDCAVLAYAAWELLPDETWSRARVLGALRQAVEVCPSDRRRERALLASTLLGLASLTRDAQSSAVMAEIEARSSSYLDLVFADAETAWAGRAFVDHRAADVARWLFPDVSAAAYAKRKARWLEAAAEIRDHAGASVDVRLWAVVPALDFFRHEHAEGPVPEALHDEVVRAVERADREAARASERHAVISGAAYLLRRVGEVGKAREMLLAEAGRTDTPFYYWSSLSALEQELGHLEEARAWSKKAREGAAGRASRLQWIANDVLLNAKLEGPSQRVYVLALVGEFYEVAFSLADGFRGRNRTRAEQVFAAIGPFRAEPAFAEALSKLAGRCASLPEQDRDACSRHFEGAR